MRNLYLFVVCAMACLISFSGCKKKDNIPPVFNYQYKGVPVADSAFTFTADSIVAGMPHFWSFGDGQTSTEENPIHRFADSGSYTVTLKINGSDVNKVSKTIKILNDPGVTAAICHSWLCSVSFSRPVSPTSGRDTTTYGADTSITVVYLNPITIAIGSDTLLYDPARSSASTVSYYASHDPYYKWLTCFVADSIEYDEWYHFSASTLYLTQYKSK